MLDAKLHLVWVNTPFNSIADDLAIEKLELTAKNHKLENYSIKVNKAFHPEEGILTYSWQVGADMIAMSTHSHKGLTHLFLGSVAEDVVNHASIPVLTYSLKTAKS